jgi:hypothetical protein
MKLLTLALAVALFTAACGGDSSPTAPTPPVAATPAPAPPPPAPLWTRSGSGADVFAKPAGVTRLRIVGDYSGRGENFIVRCDALLVNVILGTGPVADTAHYEGTHLAPTTCTQIEIRLSTNVAWSLTEVR